MVDLSSFVQPINAAVIGASGGIGQALVSALEQSEYVDHVFCFARNAPNAMPMDICDEESISHAAAQINKPLHLVIVATGLLHDENIAPEKALKDLSADNMWRLFEVNAIGPSLVAKHFIPLLPREGKTVFAAMSARVSSVSDNRLGGWHSYRTAKAALNMMIKNIAIETGRQNKETAIIGLHPGTVDTSLSLPFQGNVPEGKLFAPEQSAQYLLNVINQISHADTGKLFAWDGEEIEP